MLTGSVLARQRSAAGPGRRVRDHQPGAARRRRPGRRGLEHDPVGARRPATSPTSSTTPRVLYLSGLAVAVGFRMNLFNIGVDGQYRVAAFIAAVVAGEAWLPGYLNTVLAIAAAMAVGAALGRHRRRAARHPRASARSSRRSCSTSSPPASSPTCCARSRCASRAATASAPRRSPRAAGSPASRSATAPGHGRLRLHRHRRRSSGFAYWFVLNRTRFGFDLRATGQSTTAAVASGINVKQDDVAAMLISGAVAGLVGLPILFGERLHLRLDLPVRPRLRRHRDRAARAQPPDRHRGRRPALRLPRRAVQPAADPGRRLARHRRDHPGRRSC